MQLYDILYDIFNLEDIYAKLRSRNGVISAEALLMALCNGEESVADTLNVSETTYTRTIKYLWPDKPLGKLRNYLLHKYAYKLCANCKEVKEDTDFSKNSARRDGLNSHCKVCCLDTRRDYQKMYQAQVRTLKLQRTPTWSETEKILQFYKDCPKGCHVDHIIPLQGKTVSGLHVLSNLQYLTINDNLVKSNKFTE